MNTQSSPSFKPIKEQQRALELFLKDEGLRIDAYAGTGKTSRQLPRRRKQRLRIRTAFGVSCTVQRSDESVRG